MYKYIFIVMALLLFIECDNDKQKPETTPTNKLEVIDKETGEDILFASGKDHILVYSKDPQTGGLNSYEMEEAGKISRDSTKHVALVDLFIPVVASFTNKGDSVFYLSIDGENVDTVVFNFPDDRYEINRISLKRVPSGQYYIWYR